MTWPCNFKIFRQSGQNQNKDLGNVFKFKLATHGYTCYFNIPPSHHLEALGSTSILHMYEESETLEEIIMFVFQVPEKKTCMSSLVHTLKSQYLVMEQKS